MSTPTRHSSSPAVINNNNAPRHQLTKIKRTSIITTIENDDVATPTVIQQPQKQISAQKSSLPPLDISQLSASNKRSSTTIIAIQKRPLSARTNRPSTTANE